VNYFAALGAGATLAAAISWGMEKCKAENREIGIIEGLCSLAEYAGEQIEIFRSPLGRIYSDFSNAALEREGFLNYLENGDAEGAIDTLKDKVGDEVLGITLSFLQSLGGGYEKGQSALCKSTASRLERILEDKNSLLSEKLKMYRLLPLLIAGSVIILLI